MSLQYVLIPAVGVYEDATGTVEDGSVVYQWVTAHGAIHLLTSYDTDHMNFALSKAPDPDIGAPASRRQSAKRISD